MLRKKQRSEILFGSYNRYAHDDGNNKVPSWFTEEESQHSIALKPVTKEEVDREKELLKAVNARMPKKVKILLDIFINIIIRFYKRLHVKRIKPKRNSKK